MEVVGHLARAIVTIFLASRVDQNLELKKVTEVTTLMVGGMHRGEVIQFVAGDESFELLVRPTQAVIIVEGHSALLQRTILSMVVGDTFDIKEKIFRNVMGAFDTSRELHLCLEFDSNFNWNFFEFLEFTLFDNDGAKVGWIVSCIAWSEGRIMLPISKFKRNLTAGVWSLQASVQKQSIGMLSFVVLPEDERLK